MFDLPDDDFIDVEMGEIEVGISREAYISEAKDETERHLYDFEVQAKQTVRVRVEPEGDFYPFVTIRRSREESGSIAAAKGDLQIGDPVDLEATLFGGYTYVIGITALNGSGEYKITVEIVASVQ